MTPHFDKKIWNQPRWLHYAIGINLAILAIFVRDQLNSFLQDRAPFALSIIPVAIAAYIGGFGPGILTGLIGLVASTFFFIQPTNSLVITSFADLFQIGAAAIICIFISVVAGRLRKTVLTSALLAEQLEADRRQTRDVLQSTTDAFYAVDADWNVIQTNPAFDKLLVDRGGSILGKRLWDVLPESPGNPLYDALQTAQFSRKSSTLDVLDSAGNKCYYVRVFPTTLGVSVFFNDVTEQRQIEESKTRMLADERMARSAAEEAGRLKEEFLATLSHELRTPMTSLLGWATMLNNGKVSPERLKEGLNSIENSARIQARMVEELLDVSRINAGKLKIELEFLILSDIVEEAVSIHKPAALVKNIELAFIDEGPNSVVRGDAARMHQVFSNLISNAIKFSAKESRVQVRTFLEGSTACCEVCDEGEGIAPEFIAQVFDRFRQANSSISRKHGGLGIGLSIAKQLIELQGGTIDVKSAGRGKGSTFTTCLPLSALSEKFSHSLNDPEPTFALEGVRILIVEDDSSTRLLLTRLIEDHHGITFAAEDATMALKAIEDFRPDVILSDIGLPETDGYGFMKKVRGRSDGFEKIPAVALTAFAREVDRRAARDAGFTAFHTKPVNASALIKTLIDLVRVNKISTI